jgi:Glycosyl hydrolase family 79, N-terminal domain
MRILNRFRFEVWLLSACLIALRCAAALAEEPSIAPQSMPRIRTIEERFQSYNVEMIEITGGRFWKPYRSATPGGHPKLYEYRPPIDLANSRLRRLAAALAPVYMRVSGTWANATHFAVSDHAPSSPPPGFNGVLSQRRWKEVIDFSLLVGAEIVTSFAVSAGARDGAGIWLPDEARRFLDFTYSIGGRITAAEFMNEPNVATQGNTPAGQDAAAYARDFRTFRSYVKQNYPELLVLGPGTAGKTTLASELLAASAVGSVDAVSYHYYGTLSERCSGSSAPEQALSEEWLSGTDQTFDFYRLVRDRFEPGAPIWLTETAAAACGGNRWDATFLDTFRYLDQLGRLAKAGVQVVMHNTLAASDYGLLDEQTLAPRPNYWGALLWRRLMGREVLESGVPIQAGLHVYAHCQRGRPGGVSILVINTDSSASRVLLIAKASERFTLDAAKLQDGTVRLNGRILQLDTSDNLPSLGGVPTAAGAVKFAPATISFLAVPTAANSACQ